MNKIKKIYIDTEFIDNGTTIEIISIGLVDDKDNCLYLVADFNGDNCNDWLKENVVAKLGDEKRHSKEEIKQKIIEFLGDDKIEFYGYYSAYDWVVFCQIFGRMIDIPDNYSYYCNDLKQLLDNSKYLVKEIKIEHAHNALHDAKWNKSLHESILSV